jgi:hypothetical protein
MKTCMCYSWQYEKMQIRINATITIDKLIHASITIDNMNRYNCYYREYEKMQLLLSTIRIHACITIDNMKTCNFHYRQYESMHVLILTIWIHACVTIDNMNTCNYYYRQYAVVKALVARLFQDCSACSNLCFHGRDWWTGLLNKKNRLYLEENYLEEKCFTRVDMNPERFPTKKTNKPR